MSLESEIERAWLCLGVRPASVYVTPSGQVLKGSAEVNGNKSAQLVGAYRGVDHTTAHGVTVRAISLEDFRSDVFHVWEGMQR